MTDKPSNEELEQKVKEFEKLEDEYKRSEESLIGSETLFGAIAEQSGEGISVADSDGNYVFVNPAFCKMTGYSEAELLTMSVLDLVPPELGPELFPRVLKNQSGKREMELVKKGGSRFIAEIVGYPIKLKNQLFVLGIARDITEPKLAEEKLRESELKHKTLVNNIPGMVYRAYSDWSAEVISGSMEVCGYTNEELNSKEDNWLSIIHPDDKENVFKQGSELTKRRKDVVQIYRIITKEGDIRWIEDRKTSLFSEKDEFKGIDGIVFDVTDRKKVEEALQESEKTARVLLDASKESAFFLIDTEGTFLSMNKITAKMLGKDIKDLVGKKAYDFIPPEIVKSRKEVIKEIVLNKEPVRFEEKLFGRTLDNSLYPIIDSAGNVIRIAIYARDITKERQAEEALRASEEKYRLLAENSTDVIYKLNLKNEQYTYASPSAERIFGYTNEEILGLKASDVITPESYARQREKLEAAILQGQDEPEILEIEVMHKDGRLIPVEIHARILFDKQGVPQEILGIARDITSRKEAQDALIKEKEKLQDAVSQIKQLSGLLPICSTCKKIRDDKGYWNQIESYIRDHSEAEFSHSICPECAKKLYPDLNIDDR